MARTTINRRPMSVNTPSSKDVNQSYFNHYNWKGINQNRNFLAVDQETFSDADNIFVDDDGLLKSRLPIKFKRRFEDKIIKDLQNFDEILVCVYVKNDEWYLGIIDGEEWTAVDYKVLIDLPIKTFKNGNYIYVFTNEGFLTYNVINKKITKSPMYEAVTRKYSGSNFVTDESENLFSAYNRYQYILFPTLPNTNNESYVIDSINSNAYNKTANYSHYINETKVYHEITIDEDNDFLNIVHQPIVSDASGFHITNCYGQEMPTAFIYDDTIYRWFNNKLWRAATSDGLFEIIHDFDNDGLGEGDFVKLKLSYDNKILVIYRRAYVHVDFNGDVLDTGSPSYAEAIFDLDVSNGKICAMIMRSGELNPGEFESSVIIINESVDKTVTLFHSYDPEDKLTVSNLIIECRFITTNVSLCVFSTTITVGLFNYDVSFTDVIRLTLNSTDALYGEISDYGDYSPSTILPPTEKVTYSIVVKSGIDDVEFLFACDIQSDVLQTYYNYGKLGLYMNEYSTFSEPHDRKSEYYYNEDGLYHMVKEKSLEKGLYKGANNISGLPERKLISELDGEFVLNSFSKYWFYVLKNKNVTLSNYRLKPQDINVRIEKPIENVVSSLDLLIKSDKIYASKDNHLYIGEIIIDPYDDVEKLYFKKSFSHMLNESIQGLHQISDNSLAIFTSNETWYNSYLDGVYYYNRSKIIPVIKDKSELVTLPDSTTTLMPSINGIVAFNYQNFVNTTEQSTINLTQDLTAIYGTFESDIKNINWKQYTLFYEQENQDNKMILIYDSRSSSWWRWSLPVTITKLFEIDSSLYILSNNTIYEFLDTPDDYKDVLENNTKNNVNWYLESQKLYFGASNHYKHIYNITLASVDEGNSPIYMNLNVKNYRKYVNNGKEENFNYDINVIRTFVKRLNYAKVCEFQYRLSSDSTSSINVPLSLSDITVKYKIGGQVR